MGLSMTAKTTIGFFLIVSFIGLAVFGFVVMTQDGGCLATLVQGGATCPPNAGSLEVATFHLNAFKVFTTATFDFSGALFLVLLLSLAFVGFCLSQIVRTQLVSQNFVAEISELGLSNFKSRLNHWLSLHTNSPTAF